MSLPIVAKTHKTDKKGVRLAKGIIEEKIGWLVNDLSNDYGIDGHIEIVDDKGGATGKLIAVQYKSGKSYMKEENEQFFTIRIKKSTFNYWENYSLPVVLILCDVENEICYWTEIQKKSPFNKFNNSSYSVFIPKKQILSENSKYNLIRVAKKYDPWTKQYSINDFKSDFNFLIDFVLIKKLSNSLRNVSNMIISDYSGGSAGFIVTSLQAQIRT